MPGNPLIYILCDRELFVGDVFTYIHVFTSGTVAYNNVSSLVENTFKFSFENSIYSGKELYSKPTISLRLCRPWCDHVASLLCTGKVISVASGTSHVIMGWKRHVIMEWTRSF